MQFIGVIPARYASTRFPGKPLVNIQGKSMIRRVYEQCIQSGVFSHVVVATDDARIYDHVADFGQVVYTSVDHQSGTDRCQEAVAQLSGQLQLSPGDVVVNIQGDEPFIQPGQIQSLCACFQNPQTRIATLVKPLHDIDAILNENIVKVVRDQHGKALYFSRLPVPFVRGKAPQDWLSSGPSWFKHIGMYAYTLAALTEITALPVSMLERSEALEQLRWLENGYEIFTAITHQESIAIDTPEDLTKIPE